MNQMIPRIQRMLHKKPAFFVVGILSYALLIGFLKWHTAYSWPLVLFFVGSCMGIYFLDVAEEFFHLNPSPFRSVVFVAGLVLVSSFIVTSSGSAFASGLVLSIYLTILLWQLGELQVRHEVSSWFRMINQPVPLRAQQSILAIQMLVFLIESLVFLR